MATDRAVTAFDFPCNYCKARPGEPCSHVDRKTGQRGTQATYVHADRHTRYCTYRDEKRVRFPRYTLDTPCVKCGCRDAARTQYCTLEGARLKADDPEAKTHPADLPSEHIHRTCIRCGFHWVELPLDAKT